MIIQQNIYKLLVNFKRVVKMDIINKSLSNTNLTVEPFNYKIDDLVNLYREFAKVPIPLSAQLLRTGNERQKSLQIVSRVRDLDRMEITKFATNYLIKVTKDNNRVKCITAVGQRTDVTNDLITSSPTKESLYLAAIRKGSKDAESGKFKQWLEIWNKTTKIKSIDIDSIEEHGSVVTDPQFGNFLWSPNGKKLLYTAEYKPPKAISYYKKQSKKSDSNESDARGQEYVYREDWGEAFDGVVHTVIAILDVEKEFKIRTIEMSGHSLGQPFWINDNTIGFVGWNENPRRLGITYCPIRSSCLFTCDLKSEESKPVRVSRDGNLAIRNPRLTPDGNAIIYLDNDSGGPHDKASRLVRHDLQSKTNEVIVDVDGIRQIIPDGSGFKYGKVCSIYGDLTLNCFTSDGKHILINCFTELELILCLIDLKTKDLKQISLPTQSFRLIEFVDDLIVGVGSSAATVPNVFVGKLNNNSDSIDWLEIKVNSNELLKDITYEKFYIPSEDPTKLLTSILVSPKSNESKPAPMIVLPHGGPHSILFDTYLLYPVLFAKLGLKTLLVNYRGSLGVDEQYINCLPGNVGTMDVKDVIECAKHAIDKGLADPSKLVLHGGSHGGFLVTHLSGQYAHMDWKACVSRNPVIDVSSMLEGTDIPDWNGVEAFGFDKAYDFATPLDPMALKTMFESSPINWIQNVKVPTLLMLGKRDRRVPMTQGLKWHRFLKARGVETRAHIYDDKHDLQKVEVDSDAFINISIWILQHLK